jgi:hypothetical protein
MSANQQLITEPGPIDPHTGTRRLDLWRQDATGGQWGDDARGDGYSSRYVSDDGHGCAEVDVYPVEAEWGWDVCEQTTAGRAMRDEPDGMPRPDDAADIEYEYPHALIISSLEEAQKLAEYYGRRDYSYALDLRAPTTTETDR